MFAYLDPGTGGLLVQALLGGIAGLAVYLKTVGRKSLRFWRKTPAEESETDAPRSA